MEQDRNERQLMNEDSILQYAPGGVFVYSAEEDEAFSFVSENMLAMLGYSLEEFQNKFHNKFSEMIYQEDREATLQTIRDQISHGSFDTCYYRIEKKDGTLIWVHDEGHIVTDSAGKKWFYVVIVDTTVNVHIRTDLENKNKELQSFIDSIPVRAVVYRYQNQKLKVVAVNAFFDHDLHVGSKLLTEMMGEDLHDFVYPQDLPAVIDFFQQIYHGKQTPAEIVYRSSMNGSHEYRWYRCMAAASPQPDGCMIYCTYTDVTEQIQKEEQYNHTMQDLLTANPDSLCSFRLNLTRNVCSDGHAASDAIKQILTADTVDQLFANIHAVIASPEDAAAFQKDFTRETLLERYQKGEYHVSFSCRQKIEGGRSRWVTTYFNIMKNPVSEDVEAVAYAKDADRSHKEERIISLLTNAEYDCIGLIHVSTGEAETYYLSDKHMALSGTMNTSQYEDRVHLLLNLIEDPQEAQRFAHALSLSCIIESLQHAPSYNYSSSFQYHGRTYHKFVVFRWLEEDHKEIMFTQTDMTEAFLREEAYNEELHQALLNAEKANQMKSDFLGNVSHDMRTPLNAILGYNELAMSMKDVPPDVLNYLQKTEIAGHTLLSLINDTLDLQKIETGAMQLKPEPVSCGTVINEVITSIQPMMQAKKINFIVDNSRAVMATINVDKSRVREIFVNLLSNAAKYTPEGGEVDLIVECVNLEKDWVHDRVIVRDNGIGMSEQFLTKLYEPFSQERTKKTAHIGGSGLGLTIVKRAVELMGGTIDVKSELGKGTEFTVNLDFARVDPKDLAAKDQAPSGDIRGMRLLLCEDNDMNAEIAVKILEMNGAAVKRAEDGEIGLHAFTSSKEGEYDAVLMDIRMPVMDGYEAARAIRASSHPDAKRIPIIAISADAYTDDVRKALACGMNGHIAKPLDPEKMLQEIDRLVKQRQGE